MVDGFRLRGYDSTDKQGSYRLETVVPGKYTGRTKHFHVKVRPPGGKVLTTQLYFPGEPRNEDDLIFQPELLIDVRDGVDGKGRHVHLRRLTMRDSASST